jgi:hypothetical protein
MSRAFAAQSKIGWDQFLRGCIATHWKYVIHLYYKDRQPGAQFTPDQWMRKKLMLFEPLPLRYGPNATTNYMDTMENYLTKPNARSL